MRQTCLVRIPMPLRNTPYLVAMVLLALVDSALAEERLRPMPATLMHQLKIGPDLPVNGAFHVSVWRAGRWVKAGQSEHTTRPATGTVALEGLTPGEPVRVRIATHGPAGAQLDAALLDGQAATAAKGIKLHKLAKADRDVANTHGRTVELTFPPAAAATAALTLHGRIEPKVPPRRPLRFPESNGWHAIGPAWQSYTYATGRNPGTLTVDGHLRGEKLGEPLFTDRQSVDPGHPRGTTYGWVRDDGKTLHVAIDFTPDNTYDGDADWFAVYAKVDGRWREFKLSVPDARWGKAGFAYTGTVAYQHKVYEFAIPFAELGLAGAKPGTSLPLAFAGYGTVASPQSRPALAYDASHNQYLIVYGEKTGAGPEDIRGQRLDASGAPVLSSFLIRNNSLDNSFPHAAFDPASGRFLVVWVEDTVGTSEIWGSLVSADGSIAVAAFFIDSTGARNNPRVANNPVAGNFLVVWDDGSDVFGRLVNASTAALGSIITISNEGTGVQSLPRIAYEPNTNRYLVAWFDSRTGQLDASNVFGQLINADGSLYNTASTVNFAIANTSNAENFPGVAAIDGQFLVTWTLAGTDTDIIARRIDPATGGLLGSAIDVFLGSGDQLIPIVSGDPQANRYTVAWKDTTPNPDETDAQVIDNAGSPVSGPITVISDAAADMDFPDVATNPYCANALATALNPNSAAFTVGTTAACTPAYNLLSFAPDEAHGATIVGAGQVEFQVTWWGAAVPTTSQLWIDLDGDGTAGATVTRTWPGGAADGARWAAAAALAMLLWSAWSRRRTILLGALALGMLAGGLAACGDGGSGGGGGGGGGNDNPGTGCTNATECLTMTEVSAADTNPVDGKTYTVTVSSLTAASYAYKYVFSDGTTAAIGRPAAGGTLPLQ